MIGMPAYANNSSREGDSHSRGIFTKVIGAKAGVRLAENDDRDDDRGGVRVNANTSANVSSSDTEFFCSNRAWLARFFPSGILKNLDKRFNCPGDTVAPVISEISSSNISSSRATITWKTNEPATSEIAYGTSSSYGSSLSRKTMSVNHELALKNLSADSTYHFQISSRDRSGNVSVSSDMTFVTSKESSVQPVISDIDITNIMTGSALVTWKTDKETSSKIEYGTTTSYGGTVSSDSMGKSHRTVLSGLSADTVYHFKITAIDGRGNAAVSIDTTFKTAVSGQVKPVLSNIKAIDISDSSAKIIWTTDIASGSKVNYGVGDSYGTSAKGDGNSITHVVVLAGLKPDTVYHYQVVSEASGNISVSSDSTFKTLAEPERPVISSIAVSDLTSNSAKISWVTDVPSSGQITYHKNGGIFALGLKAADQTETAKELSKEHSVTLSELSPSSSYSFTISATGANGNTSVSGEQTLYTLSR
jgi:chitodextrinase